MKSFNQVIDIVRPSNMCMIIKRLEKCILLHPNTSKTLKILEVYCFIKNIVYIMVMGQPWAPL